MTNILTDAQLKAEIEKCEYCEEKPCKNGCPASCSPADFIMAAKKGADFDYQRAAAEILSHNPLGGVCGAVCPDTHCLSGCVYKDFNCAIKIPEVQATIIQKAKELNKLPSFKKAQSKNEKVAVIGAGPAGLGAAAVLAQEGYGVTIFEKDNKAGGRCNYIPDGRLNKDILRTDIEFIESLGNITVKYQEDVKNPADYLKEFAAVFVCTGLDQAVRPRVPGIENALLWDEYLEKADEINVNNKQVAVIGGGAVAVDCALAAKHHHAKRVDMICLESNSDMPLTQHEREKMLEYDIVVIPKTTVTAINSNAFTISQVNFPKGGMFKPEMIIPHTENTLTGYDVVVVAIGSRSTMEKVPDERIFYAGDIISGASSVVEAVASGKAAAAKFLQLDSSTDTVLKGTITTPVSLETDFFGRQIISPFILSAAPPSDGYEQVKKAYQAGWAGAVMKTAFDNVPIHIPAAYMFAYNKDTYANCDNVSEHSLDRVCSEIKKLVAEFPDRLTIGGTGGPVSGDDAADKKGWQSNTRKLEEAGAMGVEYSLSCPQGGDGTEGDIVSQNAKLTAKIIDWVMEISDPNIPKLFKLTGAVTSIVPILQAIKEVFAKYPDKKAGVTLANTFPSLAFRKGAKDKWDEAIVTGMSGDGVKNISYLTLANAANLGIYISGNGGPMDYEAAANFLALGVGTVQFCTVAMKYGVHIIDELNSGLSYLMQEKGFKSMAELIGCALPDPITDFMDLTPIKQVSTVNRDLCQHCGNCTRCPYLAITLDDEKIPVIDKDKCIGCSICTQKCFAGALYMGDREK